MKLIKVNNVGCPSIHEFDRLNHVVILVISLCDKPLVSDDQHYDYVSLHIDTSIRDMTRLFNLISGYVGYETRHEEVSPISIDYIINK